MIFDAVVVGAGLAGMTAALRLAETGRRTLVLAKGIGSLYLGGATIDVLGYAPDLVSSPTRAMPDFTATYPEHPYARLAPNTLQAAIDWFKSHPDTMEYVGGPHENLLLPTAVGSAKPSAVVPETMAAGDLRRGGSFLLVGFSGLKDFYPGYAADNLNHRAGVDAQSVELDVSPRGEPDTSGPVFARSFDDPEFRKSVVAALEERVGGEAVGFPAVLGLRDGPTVYREVRDALGAQVFEIATLPPSVPGMRLFASLKRALRRAGGRLVTNSVAVGAESQGGRVTGIVADNGSRHTLYPARDFVLATGGVSAGGIVLDSRWRFSEPVLDLPLAGVPKANGPRWVPDYFGDHPAAAAGVATDASLRPLEADGNRVYENVFVVGGTLGGARPWREQSGNGLSLATGWAAAQAILEEGGS